MPDLELICVNCRENFVFSEKEQETYYRRNMAQPQRCPNCRPTRKKLEGGSPSTASNRYEIVCDRCGRADTVPFAPKTGRPVFCSNCHGANRARTRQV